MATIVPWQKVKSYAFLQRTCSLTLRQIIIDFFPGIALDEGHARLFFKLAFTPDNTAIISQERVAAYYGATENLLNHQFSATYYLDKFQSEVMPLDIKEYSFTEGLAREASIKLPPEVLTFIEYEMSGVFSSSPKAFVADGITVNKNTVIRLEEEDLKSSQPAYYEKARFIQGYLNTLPKVCFAPVKKYIPEAKKHLYDRDINNVQIIKEPLTQLRMLNAIEEQPKPIYTETLTGNTARLFSINPSLQGIHSHLRQYITKDWIELDLAQAHLAIIATLWNIPAVTEFLESEESIWKTLLPHMGYSTEDVEVKKLLKEFLYSLVYGMSQANLKENMIASLGLRAYTAFITHPLIAEILAARKLKVKSLIEAGTYTTILGKEYKITSTRNFKTKKYLTNVNSVLSTEASEVELLLIYPIFKLASTSKSFKVLLYQFDGVSINIKDKSRIDSVIKSIQKEVSQVADELKIPTKLEVKVNKPQRVFKSDAEWLNYVMWDKYFPKAA